MHLAAFAHDCRDIHLHVAYLRDFLPDNISDRMFDVRFNFLSHVRTMPLLSIISELYFGPFQIIVINVVRNVNVKFKTLRGEHSGQSRLKNSADIGNRRTSNVIK